MRCIFCKGDSEGSRSVEHIIPEALGNTEHTLPRGVVCDTCNNYFARKIEGPLLESPWFRHARSRQWVPNKRGFVPPMTGVVPGARMTANVWMDMPRLTFEGRNEAENNQLMDAVLSGRASSVYIPIITALDQKLMARFLGKIAIEILAQRLMPVDGWEESLIDDPQLEPLRRFVRIGDRPSSWPFSRRRIYGEDDLQLEWDGGYQVLHEYTLLYTKKMELYAVVCIFGEEFAINFGGPDIESYSAWLGSNGGRSPLYVSDTLPVPDLAIAGV
jgi:HNH endonuclease